MLVTMPLQRQTSATRRAAPIPKRWRAIREAAPVRAFVLRQFRIPSRYQVVFGRAFLSNAASTSAYSRARTRMNMRSPVDRHLTIIKPVAPFAQACRRKLQLAAYSRTARSSSLLPHVSPRTPGLRANGCLCSPHSAACDAICRSFPAAGPLFPTQLKQVFRMLC
jgi:hypothetical protein